MIGAVTPDERLAIASSLASLPQEEMLDILRSVFEVQRPNPEEDEFNHNRFFLGTSTQLRSDAGDWLPWKVEAVAYPEQEAVIEPAWGFCQFGDCGLCGTLVRSNSKRGTCSVCGAAVYMT